jgi:hypothetical protein
MWLQLMWLLFEVVRCPVVTVWGRFEVVYTSCCRTSSKMITIVTSRLNSSNQCRVQVGSPRSFGSVRAAMVAVTLAAPRGHIGIPLAAPRSSFSPFPGRPRCLRRNAPLGALLRPSSNGVWGWPQVGPPSLQSEVKRSFTGPI